MNGRNPDEEVQEIDPKQRLKEMKINIKNMEHNLAIARAMEKKLVELAK